MATSALSPPATSSSPSPTPAKPTNSSRLLPAIQRLGLPIVAFTGCLTSTLASVATVALDTSVSAEACHNNLAPTASTTVMLALGDALALELSRRSGFRPQHFADLHPGGRLGHKLARVRDLMHSGDALPRVSPATPMPAVIHEMSSKKLGMTTVLTAHHTLAGIISDGDLRRLLERTGSHALERTAGEIMNPTPPHHSPHGLRLRRPPAHGAAQNHLTRSRRIHPGPGRPPPPRPMAAGTLNRGIPSCPPHKIVILSGETHGLLCVSQSKDLRFGFRSPKKSVQLHPRKFVLVPL